MVRKESSKRIGRRSALKTISAVAAALTVGTTAGAAGDDGGEISYDGLELPYPDTSVTRIDDSVRSVTNNPEMLTISEDAIDRHFEAADLDGRAYEEVRQYVADLRKDYPVEHVTRSNETTIQLAPVAPDESVIPGKEAERDLHGMAIDVFAGEGPGRIVGPNWYKNHHEDITDVLLEDTVGSDYLAVDASDEPDEFGENAQDRVEDVGDQIDLGNLDIVKDIVVDMVGGALDVYHSNYSQYHDPSIGSISLGSLGNADIPVGLGKAPQAGDAFFEEAINASYGIKQSERFGWSIHYLQDCAQPLHTSMGLEQAGLHVEYDGNELSWDFSKKKWIHYGFEWIVRANWDSQPSFGGDNLKAHMSSSGSPVAIYSAEQAIRDMAETTTGYGHDIYFEVYENQTQQDDYGDWDEDTKFGIYQDLANCFSTLGYLGHGFCEEWDEET